MNKYFIGVSIIGALLVAALAYYAYPKKHTEPLPTFFTYSNEDLLSLSGLSSNQTITLDTIRRFDEMTYQLMAKNSQNTSFGEDPSKIYAYLMMAERDFAFISFNQSGSLSGNIDHLLKRTLCLFFAADCDAIIVLGEEDAYSKMISDLVVLKLRTRMAEEKTSQKPFELRSGKELWSGPQPSVGIMTPSNKGWFIKSADQFRSEAPPAFDSPAFKEELADAVEQLKGATTEQKLATVFWAGGPGTKMLPGIFLEKAMEKMTEKGLPLEKMIYIRSLLAAAIDDANTAVFDGKYAYQVKRPFMMDDSIVTIMPTPNHPSYPSGHSTLSEAGALVLGHFFPEDKAFWEKQAEESGLSRVWGGIHYQMDHEAGKKLGMDVTGEVLKSIPATSVWEK